MIKERIPEIKSAPPANLISWLTYTEMLTARLYKVSNDTSLKVLQHDFVNCSWWDKYVLGIVGDSVLHRQVLISAWNLPCWYAKTIIPKETYVNHKKLFTMLKNKTLGDLIFADNGIKRNYLKYYAIDKDSIEYNWLDLSWVKDAETLWARLSKFTIQKDCFYLFEVFLPDLEKYTC